jgi:8-oxo-dGTP pyrophosphatase MutT (NUDIX family)
MDQDLREPEITFAAGVIAKADWPHPHRERADTGKWAFPGGRIEGDETASR